MIVTQTVDIPDNRWLTIEVPGEVPTGKVLLTFTQVPPSSHGKQQPGTAEEALKMAMEQNGNPNRKPISRHFGTLAPDVYGDGVAYQRAVRDEWD